MMSRNNFMTISSYNTGPAFSAENRDFFYFFKKPGFKNACENGNWAEAEECIRKGARNDHIEERKGGTSALWILEFEGQDNLKNELLKNCEKDEIIKTEIVTKYCQIVLWKRLFEKMKEKLKDEKWISEEEKEIEKIDGNQLKKNCELYYRCERSQWKKAEECLNKGAKNNFVENTGQTAAKWSAQLGNEDITERILKNQKNQIQRRNNRWETPLAIAFGNGQNKVAEKIIDIKDAGVFTLIF